MFRKIAFVLFFMSVVRISFSQDSTQIKWFGFLDTYYAYDLGRNMTKTRPDFIYNHKRTNEFSINLAILQASFDNGKSRAAVGLMAGTYPFYNLAHELLPFRTIYQAYGGVKFFNKIWLDAGVFNSHIGVESIISSDNITLTRSMNADNSPYYFSGVKMTYNELEKWTFMFMVSNGWQNITEPFYNRNKAIGAQIIYEPNDKILINYSNFYGKEGALKPLLQFSLPRFFNDFYVVLKPIEKLKMIASFDYGIQQYNDLINPVRWDAWYSPTVLAAYDLHEKFTLGARGEYYSDQNEVIAKSGTPNGFQTWGCSLNADYKPTTQTFLRAEIRYLNSKDAIFQREDANFYDNSLGFTLSIVIKIGN